MEHVTLSNGVRMPALGLGTFMLSPEEAEASVLAALRAGYTLVDTANAYLNERSVGRAAGLSGAPRAGLFLETKLWPAFYEQPDGVEGTLRRLGTDYVDLMLLHHPAGMWLSGYRQLEAAVDAGKVRAIGLSNFTLGQIRQILSVCRHRPVLLQTELHPYLQERELGRILAGEGIALQARYPLGHGDRELLSDPVIADIAEKTGRTPAQVILRWHTQSGHAAVVGSKSAGHIREDLESLDFTLSPEQIEAIDKLDRGRRLYTSTPAMLRTYAQFVPPID